jgi:multiple sugar transport system substrate-binding protein
MRIRRGALLLAVSLAAGSVSCTSSENRGAGQRCDGTISDRTLTAWFHSGSDDERATLLAQVDEFNDSNPDGITVKLELIPESDYSAAVDAAAASKKLPDILDFDGPLVYNYAWTGSIVPIDSCIDPELKENLLPSIRAQGEYADQFWSVGTFDSGLGLYVSKSALAEVNARIPTGPDDAWTAEEFTALLGDLRAAGYEQPLDMKMNYGRGEWFTFGFSPIIQSAGADLVTRSGALTAAGQVDSDAAVDALTIVQGWFSEGYVTPNADDSDFVSGRSAISWVGHWMYGAYAEALGDDLMVVPLPTFGEQPVSGQGSWNWGISADVGDPDAAWSFIEYLMTDEQILRMTDANGAVPATTTAVEKSENYAEGGPLRLFAEQLSEGVTVPRPQTPAYRAITTAFAQAFDDISNGADVRSALEDAAAAIDDNIDRRRGYPPPEE